MITSTIVAATKHIVERYLIIILWAVYTVLIAGMSFPFLCLIYANEGAPEPFELKLILITIIGCGFISALLIHWDLWQEIAKAEKERKPINWGEISCNCNKKLKSH